MPTNPPPALPFAHDSFSPPIRVRRRLVLVAALRSKIGLVASALVAIAAAVRLRLIKERGAQRRAVVLGRGCGSPSGCRTRLYATPAAMKGEPIVCTADLQDRAAVQAQIDGYRVVFAHWVETERLADGFRWIFRRQPGLEPKLVELAQNEHACCRFFEFDIALRGETIVWQVRADAAAAAVLEELSYLPDRLRGEPREHDLAALKRGAETAGLVFASDAKSR